MDPFAQQVQRIENNDKVREIVAALRLIPIDDVNTRNQLNDSLERILTPAAHKIPETQKKITEFTFTEPEFLVPRLCGMAVYFVLTRGDLQRRE